VIGFSPSDEQQLIVRTLTEFASAELRAHARAHERARSVSEELQRAHHQLGATLIELPEEAGGAGLGAVTAALAREALAVGDVAAAIELDGPGAAALALLELGGGDQARRWLAPFAAADGHRHRAALAFSEASPPPPGRLFGTRAVPDGGDYLISGEKAFVVGAPLADLVVVVCELAEHGDAGPLVPAAFVLTAPAWQAGPRLTTLGLDAVAAGSLRFDRARVPASARLPLSPSPEVALTRLWTRLALAQAARAVGLAQASATAALAYAQERTAFGRPVAHFQAMAFLLADISTELDAARLMTWRAAALLDAGRTAPAELLAAASMASAQATRAAEWITERGVQVLGGAGYLQDHLQEKWMRDAKMLALMGPSREDAYRLIGAVELGPEVQEVQWEPAVPLPGPELQPLFT
jgi:alkylation response protein AidB-like acyl-CoA dehydrogenase